MLRRKLQFILNKHNFKIYISFDIDICEFTLMWIKIDGVHHPYSFYSLHNISFIDFTIDDANKKDTKRLTNKQASDDFCLERFKKNI